ncbi:MAG: type II toxin-antitoxin system VapC family toxin [Pseudomonadales bacterium]|jgi:predicted nucleic acid-binding protein|nr:type II toxin-antitoxin system VapC family toxin [Pseudomonadales bacterium]
MILVDTSVWIAHLNVGEPLLTELLEQGEIVMHPSVLGELACGNLRNRRQLLGFMQDLPEAITASDDEVLRFINDKQLMGKGIGYVDAQLLASMALSSLQCLWTRDRRLAEAARSLGYLAQPEDTRSMLHESAAPPYRAGTL